VEVVANCVIDETLLLLRLAARLVPENHVVIPAPFHFETFLRVRQQWVACHDRRVCRRLRLCSGRRLLPLLLRGLLRLDLLQLAQQLRGVLLIARVAIIARVAVVAIVLVVVLRRGAAAPPPAAADPPPPPPAPPPRTSPSRGTCDLSTRGAAFPCFSRCARSRSRSSAFRSRPETSLAVSWPAWRFFSVSIPGRSLPETEAIGVKRSAFPAWFLPPTAAFHVGRCAVVMLLRRGY
jgi:hypothetical protein